METDPPNEQTARNAIIMAKDLIEQALAAAPSNFFPEEHDVLRAFLEDRATLGAAIQALHVIEGTKK